MDDPLGAAADCAFVVILCGQLCYLCSGNNPGWIWVSIFGSVCYLAARILDHHLSS